LPGSATSSPSANFTPRISFGNWLLPVEASPTFPCGFDELEDHGERGAVRQASFRPDRAVAHGRECAFDGVRGPQVIPVHGREVVESRQRVAILVQAFCRFFIFYLVALDECIERSLSVSPPASRRLAPECTASRLQAGLAEMPSAQTYT
jgi:hypothetical protein